MLEARKDSWWSFNYKIREGDKFCASIKSRWLKGPLILVGSEIFEVLQTYASRDKIGLETFFRASLVRNGDEFIVVESQTKLSGTWVHSFSYQGHTYTLKYSYGKTFQVFDEARSIGAIRFKQGTFATFEIDLPPTMPLYVQIFLFTLFLSWQS